MRKLKYCDVCGVKDEGKKITVRDLTYAGIVRHHIKPKHLGGNFENDGSLYLCIKHHKEIHTKNGKIQYEYVDPEKTNLFIEMKNKYNFNK